MIKSLHVASSYCITRNRMNTSAQVGFASSTSPRGTGPQWDVPQLAFLKHHQAQHVFLSLDVV